MKKTLKEKIEEIREWMYREREYPLCWNSGCPENCCYIDSRIPFDCPYRQDKKP